MELQLRPEHEWLKQFIGEWRFETVAVTPAGEERVTGTEVVRGIGAVWIVCEAEHETPDGPPARSVMTLGYDPDQGRFVGSFIASMMTFMWVYRGQLGDDGSALLLDTQGPSFSQPGELVDYQDRVERIDADHRALSSHMRGEDGTWSEFMRMTYTRVR